MINIGARTKPAPVSLNHLINMGDFARSAQDQQLIFAAVESYFKVMPSDRDRFFEILPNPNTTYTPKELDLAHGMNWARIQAARNLKINEGYNSDVSYLPQFIDWILTLDRLLAQIRYIEQRGKLDRAQDPQAAKQMMRMMNLTADGIPYEVAIGRPDLLGSGGLMRGTNPNFIREADEFSIGGSFRMNGANVTRRTHGDNIMTQMLEFRGDLQRDTAAWSQGLFQVYKTTSCNKLRKIVNGNVVATGADISAAATREEGAWCNTPDGSNCKRPMWQIEDLKVSPSVLPSPFVNCGLHDHPGGANPDNLDPSPELLALQDAGAHEDYKDEPGGPMLTAFVKEYSDPVETLLKKFYEAQPLTPLWACLKLHEAAMMSGVVEHLNERIRALRYEIQDKTMPLNRRFTGSTFGVGYRNNQPTSMMPMGAVTGPRKWFQPFQSGSNVGAFSALNVQNMQGNQSRWRSMTSHRPFSARAMLNREHMRYSLPGRSYRSMNVPDFANPVSCDMGADVASRSCSGSVYDSSNIVEYNSLGMPRYRAMNWDPASLKGSLKSFSTLYGAPKRRRRTTTVRRRKPAKGKKRTVKSAAKKRVTKKRTVRKTRKPKTHRR